VFFALGVTAVDSSRQQILFERYISKERAEPPDIDIVSSTNDARRSSNTFARRMVVTAPGLAANVISYRQRSALCDVARPIQSDIRICFNTRQVACWFVTFANCRRKVWRRQRCLLNFGPGLHANLSPPLPWLPLEERTEHFEALLPSNLNAL
jgi:hypothetical protein